MLKLGGSNISKMFLGGHAISKAYLGSNLVYSAAQPLPYDAEVDWLEATGTQWIDTGIQGRLGLEVSLRFKFSISPSGSSTASESLFGVYFARTSCLSVQRYYNATYGGVPFALMVGATVLTGDGDSDWHTALLHYTSSEKFVELDAVRTTATSTYEPTSSPNIYLFAARNTNGFARNPASGRVSACRIVDTATGQVIQDLIPVRKNGVGYMYDKVSGQLLGNSGTGAFSYGPDKPYDYEVEYIQRDCSVAWLNASGSAGTGGYDISEYLDGSSMMTTTRQIEARWSTDAGTNVGGQLASIISPTSAFGAGVFLGRVYAGDGYRYNSWWLYTIGENAAPQFDINTLHTTKTVPDGSGTWTYDFDGTQVGSSQPSVSTVAFRNIFLLRHSSTNTYQNLRMRVSFARLGSDAYFIPVKKGTQLGFYNMVDGELFLEEQACLSAGAIVR